MAAYQLYNAETDRYVEDYQDDGDYNLGKAVMKKLVDRGAWGVMVFITRQFGQIHLGKKRYDIVNQLVDKILDKIN